MAGWLERGNRLFTISTDLSAEFFLATEGCKGFPFVGRGPTDCVGTRPHRLPISGKATSVLKLATWPLHPPCFALSLARNSRRRGEPSAARHEPRRSWRETSNDEGGCRRGSRYES